MYIKSGHLRFSLFLVKASQFFVQHSDLCTTMPYSFSTNGVIYNSPIMGPSLYGEPMVYINIYQLINNNISSKNMSNKVPPCWEVISLLKFHLLLQKKSPCDFYKKIFLFSFSKGEK